MGALSARVERCVYILADGEAWNCCFSSVGDKCGCCCTRSRSAMNFAYRVCSENAEPEHDYDFSKCQKESEKTYEVFLQHSWASAAPVALVPLPLFWLLAYQLVGIWLWVRRGFIAPF